MYVKKCGSLHALRIGVFLLFLAVFCIPLQCFAQGINPLVSSKQQLKEINRDCAGQPYHPHCIEMKKRLKKQIDQLRDICRTNPADERCASIMTKRRNPGWHAQEKCMKDPHSKTCSRRRERRKHRDKMRRKFCRKNPEAKRCFSKARKKKRWNVIEYCKAQPDKMVCRKLKARQKKLLPDESEKTNNF